MKFRTTLLFLITFAFAIAASAQVCDLVISDEISAPGALDQAITTGNTAYVAAHTAGIVRIDISDPKHPFVIDSGATAGEAKDLLHEYFKDLLIVADGSAGIGAYSLDGDGRPVEIGTTNLGEDIITIIGNSGSYLAGSEQGRLFTISLDGNNMPTLDGSINLGGEVVGIAQRSGLAYCAMGSGNSVAIVDVSDRTNLVRLSTLNLNSTALSIEVSGRLLLVGVEGLGLQTFNINGETAIAGEPLVLDHAPTSIFMWDDRIHLVAPDFGIYEIDASLGDGLLKIAELELPGALNFALAGDSMFVSRGEQGFASVDISGCNTQGGRVTTRYIPASARAVGAQNSFWVTDVAITNFTTGIASFNIAYLAKDTDNSNPLNTSMVIGSGRQLILADIFLSLFGRESGNGALRITTSDSDVKITSRTYNAAGLEGTYGQFIPALESDASMVPGVFGTLLQLQENDNFRTNIGLLNITAIEVQAAIHLYDGAGAYLGVMNPETTLLKPYEMKQIGSVFSRVTGGDIDSGYAIIQVSSAGGKALSYASVVDQNSNDPIYIPAQQLSSEFRR